MPASSSSLFLVELGEERFERTAHHFAALIEGGFHHAAQQALIAATRRGLVARHADDGTLHLGRRIENALAPL